MTPSLRPDLRISRREVLVATLSTAVATTSGAGVLAQSATPASEATPETPQFTVNVRPERVRFDERFEVWVTGLEPYENATVTSRFEDAVTNIWATTAEFKADQFGNIILSGSVPISGIYNMADSMALVWAALSRSWVYAPNYSGDEVIDIICERTDGTAATTSVVRSIGESASQFIDIYGEGGVYARYLPPLND